MADESSERWVWPKDEEEQRAWLVYHLADDDVEGRVMVENLDAIFKWIKTGRRPAKPKLVDRADPDEAAAIASHF